MHFDEIRETYGFPTNAIVTMEEVVEHLYNKECQGKIVINDEIKKQLMHTMNSMDVNNAMDDRKKKTPADCRRIVTVYFAVLFYFLFFSEKMGRTYSERAYHYNLVPLKRNHAFHTLSKSSRYLCSGLNLVGNIIAFMPFGTFCQSTMNGAENCGIRCFTALN